MEDATESLGVTVQSAFVGPNEHLFYLMVKSDMFEELTSLVGPPILQDYEADMVPVTTLGEALDTLDVE